MRSSIKTYLILFIFLFVSRIYSQNFNINKIEPPNWWAGMKLNKIELMVYGENLSGVTVESDDDYNIEVLNTEYSPTGKYMFVQIGISPEIEEGNYKLIFSKNGLNSERYYPIMKRRAKPNEHKGFNQHDVIYLITPDRFADGDSTNNRSIGGMPDQFNRSDKLARHGGDIKGIINHLDYLANLGVTALWINPLTENNTAISYHGYASTNFYRIDPRFGTNNDYKNLVAEAHKRGIKIILDHVSNHIGISHPWMNSLPFPDWIHGTAQKHLNALHEKMSYFDVHAANEVTEHLEKGWFVNEMPDLNQSNRHLAAYLIQNTIWWIEFAGIDGVREDTYSYVNPFFESNWASAILNEYPKTNIVGEIWSGEPSFLAAYQARSKIRDFNTVLPSVTDFALRDAFADFLQGKSNLSKFYNVFAKDYLYPNPENLVTFIDNHDVERPMLLANGDLQKVKLAYVILFTTRGIPEILYGDEVGLKGGYDDGDLRQDFPGGWSSDKQNAFDYNNLYPKEKALFDHISKLISLRKMHPALASGQLIHYPVKNNIYYYLKILGQKKYLIILNGNNKNIKPDLSLIKNKIEYIPSAVDLFSNNRYVLSEINLQPYGFVILELN